MKKKNIILLTLFSIFLILTIAEIIYYFLFVSPKKSFEINTAENLQNQQQVNINPNQAISPKTIDYIQSLNKEFLTSSKMTNEIKGEILNITTTSGAGSTKTQLDYQYGLIITIKNSNNENFRFIIHKDSMSLLNVYNLENNNTEAPISYNDLKTGDNIIIKETIDLKSNPEDGLQDLVIIRT